MKVRVDFFLKINIFLKHQSTMKFVLNSQNNSKIFFFEYSYVLMMIEVLKKPYVILDDVCLNIVTV